jgi:hypothetical protein
MNEYPSKQLQMILDFATKFINNPAYVNHTIEASVTWIHLEDSDENDSAVVPNISVRITPPAPVLAQPVDDSPNRQPSDLAPFEKF